MEQNQIFTRPTYLEVSSHFLHDAIDFNIRYKFCMESDGPLFGEPKSRRAKCFIDLRMGIESDLKSLICYHDFNNRKGKTLVKWIEKFRHNIERMTNRIEPYLAAEFMEKHKSNLLKLEKLPVDLRYRFDTWEFSENQEALYDETIGCNRWLTEMYQILEQLIDLANCNLKQHGGIVTMEEVLKELTEPRFKKHT